MKKGLTVTSWNNTSTVFWLNLKERHLMSWMEDLDNLKTNQFLEETEKSREEPVVRWLELKLHQEEKEQMVKKMYI